MQSEEKEANAEAEDRFKFDLFTRQPEIYNQMYGEASRARMEEEAEFYVPSSPEEVQSLLESLKG